MLLQDPDLLNRDTELVFDLTNKTFQLVKAGNLSDDGVTIQALYSKCKELWKTQADLIKYPFLAVAITPEQFEFVSGWTPKDATTINLLRNGGFAVKNADGSSGSSNGILMNAKDSISASETVYVKDESHFKTKLTIVGD